MPATLASSPTHRVHTSPRAASNCDLISPECNLARLSATCLRAPSGCAQMLGMRTCGPRHVRRDASRRRAIVRPAASWRTPTRSHFRRKCEKRRVWHAVVAAQPAHPAPYCRSSLTCTRRRHVATRLVTARASIDLCWVQKIAFFEVSAVSRVNWPKMGKVLFTAR